MTDISVRNAADGLLLRQKSRGEYSLSFLNCTGLVLGGKTVIIPEGEMKKYCPGTDFF